VATTVHIKENSWIAALAAKKMRSSNVAIVFGKTIYLHNISRQAFLKNERWLCHELVHVRQYAQHGFLPFLFLYLKDWIKKGYFKNKFEVEARAGERQTEILKDFVIKEYKR